MQTLQAIKRQKTDFHRHERGVTLIETIVTVVIASIIATVVVLANSNQAEKRPTTVRIVESALNQAVSIATGTGNGATVLFTPQSTQLQVQVFAGRPNGQTPDASTATLVHTSVAPLGVTTSGQNTSSTTTGPSYAVFIDNFGHASYGTWGGPGTGTTTPVCSVAEAPLKINIDWDTSSNGPTESLQLPCGGSKFSAYDANGNLMPDLPAGT
jgi:prepilin-type N-terminal cleavage/methylation domain-containing protein